MSGLIGNLLANSRSLNAHSRQVETAGRNLANVNNENYSRQRVQVGHNGHHVTDLGAQGMGLAAQGIEHIRDAILDDQVLREVMLRSDYEARQRASEWLEKGLGEQIDRIGETEGVSQAAGLTRALDDFFTAWTELEANPNDTGARQVLAERANILVDRMNTLGSRLETTRSDLDGQIASDTDKANRILSDIASLNNQIGRLELRRPGSAVDLRDERQAKLEELATLIDFRSEASPTNGGDLRIWVGDGTGTAIDLVDGPSQVTSLTATPTGLVAGNPPQAVAERGGSIAGYLNIRDGLLVTTQTELDALARQLTLATNSVYNPTGTSTNFFDAATTGATSFSVDPTLDINTLRVTNTINSGENEIARGMTDLAQRSFSTLGGDEIDGTFGSAYRQIVTNVGASVSSSEQRVENQKLVEQMLKDQRESVSGVALDEEMADLMRFQRAFQASARVMNVLDDLLDQVVNGLVR